MGQVLTPDGWGQVLSSESVRGITRHLVKGAGFEGWYDSLQVTSDFAETLDPDEMDDDNTTVLPYPSRAQGPGWDGTTSTIPPDVDPHLESGHASDSLTGEPTDEDPVEADIQGLFEAPSRLAGVRNRRIHFAASDDPILDVGSLPGESPTGLENSPLNPDDVDTDDLFDGSEPHFERAASYDRLVIDDNLSFMHYAAEDDDDKKKHHHEQGQSGFPKDDDDNDDDDGDDSSSSDSSEDSSSSDSGSDSDGGSGDGGSGGHTAAFALTTTSDLHFLANFCVCAEELPLHSKSEHRELVFEGGLKSKKKKGNPLGSKPLSGHHGDSNPKTPSEAGYAKGGGVAKTLKKTKKGTKNLKVERPIKHSTTVNGVEPQEQDLEKLLERYQQDNFNYQESNLDDLVDRSLDDGDNAGLYNHYASVHLADDGYDKYIGDNGDGTFHLIASGGGKLPKGERYGHYDSREDAHNAVEAIIARNHSKTAAPAAAEPGPTQIESQIEQLMQFWATDSNNWWHWTGSQADLALLNQMQQQMAAVGQPSGPPGQMQAQGSFQIEANTPPQWREYLQVISSDRLVALAAWRDVVAKSKRLRSEGAVEVEAFRPDVVTAYIQGDHGRYYTTVQRLGSVEGMGRQGLTSTQVSGWSCECEWGHWAYIRKRSFVGRMCSHAYALFSEMRSLDAKGRRAAKGKPIGGGQSLSSMSKTTWIRSEQGGFVWVSNNLVDPTAAITKSASGGWNAHIWSDGTADDSFDLGEFNHSEQARRAISRVIAGHFKIAEEGDIDVVGGEEGDFPPYGAPDSIPGGQAMPADNNPYSADGTPEDEMPPGAAQGSTGIEEGRTRVGSFSIFSASDDGQDDEGPEEEDDGIQEEEPDDDADLDEEIAEDEDESSDGADDAGDEEADSSSDDDISGKEVPHKRDDDDDSGTDNPGDESDDDGIEKESSSSVAELQARFGLSHLAGANYSLAQQDSLVRESEGKTARNRGDLNLAGTHYEASDKGTETSEDVLAFLF